MTCLPPIDDFPEQPIDPPEERDLEAEIEAAERQGEADFELWRADGYPKKE